MFLTFKYFVHMFLVLSILLNAQPNMWIAKRRMVLVRNKNGSCKYLHLIFAMWTIQKRFCEPAKQMNTWVRHVMIKSLEFLKLAGIFVNLEMFTDIFSSRLHIIVVYQRLHISIFPVPFSWLVSWGWVTAIEFLFFPCAFHGFKRFGKCELPHSMPNSKERF